MKSRKPIAGILAMTMLLTTFATFQFDKDKSSSNADAAFSENNVISDIADAVGTSYDADATLGTVENPFSVLEIVPYKGMGLMGYTVPGQEPIKLSSLTQAIPQLSFAYSNDATSMLTYKANLHKKSEIPEGETGWTETEFLETGYFQKESKVGKGDYNMIITPEDVDYIPVYEFLNGVGSNKSLIEDRLAAVQESYVPVSDEQKDNLVFYKDITFKKLGTSAYTVDESNYSQLEVIFEYITDTTDTSCVTYDACLVQSFTDYYDNMQHELPDGEVYCYEPAYAYDDINDLYYYDPTATERYNILFVKNPSNTGKYKVSKVLDLSTYTGVVNRANCYFSMVRDKYTTLESDVNRYNVGATYSKEVYTDPDDESIITEIAFGNYDVLFTYNPSATGVKKYKPVASDAITAYFEDLKAANTDPTISYEPTYIKRGTRYIPLTDRTDTESARYVLFVEDPSGDYVVGSVTERLEGTEENKKYMASMYKSSLGVSKNDTGKYKAKVNNATFVLEEGRGLYTWNVAEMPATEVTDYLADKVWIKNYKFKYYTKGGYVNNNWFAKKILGLTDAQAKDYKVVVNTITPGELTTDLIKAADLVYISDNVNDSSCYNRMYMWEKYGRDTTGSGNLTVADGDNAKLNSTDSFNSYLNFYAKDASWDMTLELFKRAAGLNNDFVPIVIDSTLYTETLKGDTGRYASFVNATNGIKKVKPKENPYTTHKSDKYYGGSSNLFKLYVMLHSCDSPLVFYNKYLRDTIPTMITLNVNTSSVGWKNSAYIYYWASESAAKHNLPLTKLSDYNFTISLSQSSFPKGAKFIIKKEAGWTGNNEQTNDIVFNYDELCTYNVTVNKYGSGKHNCTVAKAAADTANISAGKYNKLSGDAANYWNELTFFPSLSSNSDGNMINAGVHQYIRELVLARDAEKRVSDWPSVSNKKNVFSFDATKVSNIYSKLNSSLKNAGATTCENYMKEAKDAVIEMKGALDNTPTVSWVETLYYIINYNLMDNFDIEINNKPQVNVLELEPCRDFTMDANTVREWLPEYTGEINVTQWISTEYIGKKNNVNEDFDIIYMGDNSGFLETDFNDNNLDGKIYAHIGDKAWNELKYNTKDGGYRGWITYNIAGKKPDGTRVSYKIDSDNFRMSGNDITKVKYQELENYVSGQYAVVLCDTLYNKNTSKIDTSSYIYQFLKNNVGKDNVILEDDLSAISNINGYGAERTKLQSYAGKTKLTLDISQCNDDIIASTVAAQYTEYDSHSLVFNYSINDRFAAPGEKYKVTLFADTNGDGIYEDLEAIAIDTGRKCVADGGTTYTIQRELTSDFSGLLHWVLKVESQVNSQKTDTIEGYLLFKNTSDKKVIRILQINHDKNKIEYNSWNTACKGNRNTTFSLKSSTFNSYLNTPDVTNFYKVEVTEMTSGAFGDKFNPSKNGNKRYNKNDPKTNYLKNYTTSVDDDYNMIVYGFADGISDISNDHGAFDAIMDFVDEGKALLATHDTTSMYNFSGLSQGLRSIQSDSFIVGMNSNQFLRDAVGMNRYGVPTLYTLRKGITRDPDAYDTPYTIGSNQGSTFGTTDGAWVGYSEYLMKWTSSNKAKAMYKAKYTDVGSASNFSTNVNQGQITRFPYLIDDTIDTANTHGQYYQLNMDDPNICIWYCLGGMRNQDNSSNLHYVSRNDARNYYYIYSYKNIFYTGVGHASVSSDMELKLFVNTLIAAYRAGIEPPEIKVTNEESNYTDPEDNINQSILYYYADLGSSEDKTDYPFAGKTLDVRIQPKDYNLFSDLMKLRLYDQEGNDITASSEVYLVADNGDVSERVSLKTPEAGDGDTDRSRYLSVRSNYHYVYKFPLEKLSGSSDGTYSITAILKNAKNAEYIKLITVGKRTLFELQ